MAALTFSATAAGDADMASSFTTPGTRLTSSVLSGVGVSIGTFLPAPVAQTPIVGDGTGTLTPVSPSATLTRVS